jgi:P27 family predicted phage terminase small subunit
VKPGPPPKPVELKVLQGNPGHRPLKKDAIKPTAGASCPRVLSRAARAEWARIYPELERLGLITQLDPFMLACYCEAVADFIWATRETRRGKYTAVVGENATEVQAPAVSIKRASMQKIREFAAEFGFSPSARARIHMPGASDGDDEDETRFFGIPGPHAVPSPKPRKPPA